MGDDGSFLSCSAVAENLRAELGLITRCCADVCAEASCANALLLTLFVFQPFILLLHLVGSMIDDDRLSDRVARERRMED